MKIAENELLIRNLGKKKERETIANKVVQET